METDLEYFLTRAGQNLSLVLEITEREVITGDDRIRHKIARLRARGVRFALDDFGTGYSTLETLHHTPVELIKIDRLFTAGIGSNELCQAIIANIIDLAKRIDIGLIAEGGETKCSWRSSDNREIWLARDIFFRNPFRRTASKNG